MLPLLLHVIALIDQYLSRQSISRYKFSELRRIIRQRRNVFVHEAIGNKFSIGGPFITAEDHALDFIDVFVVGSFLVKLFDESWAGIPFGFLVTIFVESRDIGDQFETITQLERFLEKLRINIRPSQLR